MPVPIFAISVHMSSWRDSGQPVPGLLLRAYANQMSSVFSVLPYDLKHNLSEPASSPRGPEGGMQAEISFRLLTPLPVCG